MSRKRIAKALASATTWTLRNVFHRQAENFPGKVGLLADPNLIADLRSELSEGIVVVVGTNGKTTVTNLLACALEAAGKSVACNRTGANLDSGVASALLHAGRADWGVFESDELWLAKVVPQLRPSFVVLLNLFRDQLDRMGEIALIQDSIAGALASSPETALVYNCDDPLCQAIADRVPNACVPFGINQELRLRQNTVSDTGLCQRCDALLEYEWRLYGQLGAYACPQCGFARTAPAYSACDIARAGNGVQMTLRGASHLRLEEPFAGTYMIYNVLAAYAAADLCGVPPETFGRAVGSFDPHNGRLQRYDIGGMPLLLNLAKNPTGMNESLRIACADPGPKAIAIFINDREADGHDVSWLWDADFQELAESRRLTAFAGGLRRNDLQVRLKHAGVEAALVDGARDFLQMARKADPAATCYVIANYTALPGVKADLDRMQEEGLRAEAASAGTSLPRPPDVAVGRAQGRPAGAMFPHQPAADCGQCCPENARAAAAAGASAAHPTGGPAAPPAGVSADSAANGPAAHPTPNPAARPFPEPALARLRIVHLFPSLLNLYGDGGNVTILANRARWHGMDVEVRRIDGSEGLGLADADIVFLGGGPDREQRLASARLADFADELRAYVEDDGVLLAICGGYQILGRTWLMGDEEVAGLGIVDAETKRAPGNARNRLVGNIALESPLATMPVIGYENHAGRTHLGADAHPLGRVANRHAHGNDDAGAADGVLYRNVVGTYLHGPLLAKNPEVADWLIGRALARRAAKEGCPLPVLPPLDDTEERAANAFMQKRLGI